MPSIHLITFRRILNSHVQYTNEFIIIFKDGSKGVASSPQGETISIYEDRKITIDPLKIIHTIENDGLIGKALDQKSFDEYLNNQIPLFGRNNVYGLSEAYFNASCKTNSFFELFGKPKTTLKPPCICLNILNGGWHAYTNPVLSDFSEFMLVSKSNNLDEVIEEHNEIQGVVKERQLSQSKTVVSGNPVNCFTTRDNREVIEFLLNVLESLGYSKKYDLMIDASAGDLWNGKAYSLGVTDNSIHSSEEFIQYWLKMKPNSIIFELI